MNIKTRKVVADSATDVTLLAVFEWRIRENWKITQFPQWHSTKGIIMLAVIQLQTYKTFVTNDFHFMFNNNGLFAQNIFAEKLAQFPNTFYAKWWKIRAIMSMLSRHLCPPRFRVSSVAKKRTRKISLGRDNTETTILCPIYWLRLIVSRHVLNELHDEIKANVRNPCRHPSRTRIVLLNSTTTILTFGYVVFICLKRFLCPTPIWNGMRKF